MADDDTRSGGPEVPFVPPGPRRSTYTPPTGDAESVESASRIFDDDDIAAAMAAELARVASGPIPIIRPEAQPPVTPEAAPPSYFAPPATVPSAPIDPDAYRGAPAPTVPAADVPPPPGYESSVPRTSAASPAPGPHPPFDAPSIARPPVEPPLFAPDGRPLRRSLDDEELQTSLQQETDKPGGTLDALASLQQQLALREQEARAFADWENTMRAQGTPEAIAHVEEVRSEFEGVVNTSSVPIVPNDFAAPAAPPAAPAAEPQPFEPTADAPADFAPSSPRNTDGSNFEDLLSGVDDRIHNLDGQPVAWPAVPNSAPAWQPQEPANEASAAPVDPVVPAWEVAQEQSAPPPVWNAEPEQAASPVWNAEPAQPAAPAWDAQPEQTPPPPAWNAEPEQAASPVWNAEPEQAAPPVWNTEPAQPAAPAWDAQPEQTAPPSAWNAEPEQAASPVWNAEPEQAEPPVWNAEPEQAEPPVWNAEPEPAEPPVWNAEPAQPVAPAWDAQPEQPTAPAWDSAAEQPAPPVWVEPTASSPIPPPAWNVEPPASAPAPPWGSDPIQPASDAAPEQPAAPAWDAPAAAAPSWSDPVPSAPFSDFFPEPPAEPVASAPQPVEQDPFDLSAFAMPATPVVEPEGETETVVDSAREADVNPFAEPDPFSNPAFTIPSFPLAPPPLVEPTEPAAALPFDGSAFDSPFDSPAFDGSAFVTPPVDQQPVAQPPFTPPPFAEPVPQPASPPAQHSDDEPPTMDSLFGALSSTGEQPAESAPAPFGDFAPFGADSQVPAPAAVQPPPTEVLPPSEIPDVPPSLPVDGPVPTTASAPPPADEAAPFPFVSGRADLTLTGAAAGTETPESDPNFEPVLPADSLTEQAEVDAPVAAAIAAEPVIAAHPRAFVVEPVGLEPTPLDQRVGRAARLFWMWFATNASVVSVGFGGLVFALGMSLRQSIVATLAGVALSFLPLGLGTLAGKRSGMPTMVISRATFGVTGNVLPAIFGLVSRLFWGAVLLWVLGSGAASILTGASFSGGLTQQQLTLAIVVVGFVLAAVIAFFGYGLIARIQLTISVVAAVLGIGFVALTWHWVSFPTALTVGDGPWILVVTGGVLVFSFVGLVWANSSADLARYQRPGSSGGGSMLWATFGTALPSFLLIAYGAVLAASDPRIAAGLLANPMDQLGRLLPVWYPVPLVLATVLSLLSGVVISVYSAGFALQATGLNLKRPLSVVATGVLLLAIAAGLALTVTDFTSLFRDFATTLAVPIAAWAGIFAAEVMIRNRRFDSVSLLRRGGVYADVRWVNLIALVVITIIGLGLTSATVAGLAWEGYLFTALGIPLTGEVARTDLGVLVALVLGLIVPVVAGVPAIRRQESAERAPE